MINLGKVLPETIELSDFKSELINKWAYSEDFAENIAITAESLIDYYGYEYKDLIINAVLSCKFIVAKKTVNSGVYDSLKNENMMTEEELQLNSSNLKHAESSYVSKPNITKKDGTFIINGEPKRVIALSSNFDFERDFSKAAFVHEMGHLVKSYIDEYKIDGNILTERSGLIERKYTLSDESDILQKKLTSEVGIGIEEGLNSYDEEQLVHEYLSDEYEAANNIYQRVTAEVLSSSSGLKNELFEAQLLGDTSKLKSIINENTSSKYEEIIAELDEIAKLESKRCASLDKDEQERYLSELQVAFEKKVVPPVKELKNNLTIGEPSKQISM